MLTNFNAERAEIDLFANNVLPSKRCSKCKEHKALTEFGKYKGRKDGLNYYCKQCNRDKTRDASRDAHRKLLATPQGREKSRASKRKYIATPEGREKARAATLNYAKNHPRGIYAKLANDPLYKLQFNIRVLIRQSLKNTGHKKSSRTAEILGCSIEQFKAHLEAQFANGMTLDNHGALWHVDHMIPISWARTEQECLVLNHYSNFQPLLAAENIAKGNRLSACGLTKEQWYAANPIPLALNK
jgi:hypothetical protein